MTDLNKLLPDVSGKYGAPMGRRDVVTDPQAEVHVFRVRWVDGDYDRGGAYWGSGGGPLYCAMGEGAMAFARAPSRRVAIALFRRSWPELRFKRGETDGIAE